MIKTATAKVPVKIFIALCIPTQQNLWRMLQFLRRSSLWKVIIDNPSSIEIESIEQVALNFKEMQPKHHLNPVKHPWYLKKIYWFSPRGFVLGCCFIKATCLLAYCNFFYDINCTEKKQTRAVSLETAEEENKRSACSCLCSLPNYLSHYTFTERERVRESN